MTLSFAPSRRDLLRLAAIAPAFALASPLRAAAALAAQNDGWFRFTLGEAEVTIVSDGHLLTPAGVLGVNADPEEVKAYLAAHRLPTDVNYAHTNHAIIRLGDHVTLVDVGSGTRFQPSAGRLIANMEAAGFTPEVITDVALTHAHPDHVWGAFDEFDEPLIPETPHHIGAAERDWWMADGLLASVPESFQAFVAGAQNTLGPLGEADLLQAVADETEVAPGVQMLASPGHTMGHMSVIVESAGEKMLVTGDALNHGYISFEKPEWQFGFDTDKTMAVETRKALLARAADEGMVVVGYHFPFPGVGHVVREGEAFRFLPALWRWAE